MCCWGGEAERVRERVNTRQSRLHRRWRTIALDGDKRNKNEQEQRREDVCDRHGESASGHQPRAAFATDVTLPVGSPQQHGFANLAPALSNPQPGFAASRAGYSNRWCSSENRSISAHRSPRCYQYRTVNTRLLSSPLLCPSLSSCPACPFSPSPRTPPCSSTMQAQAAKDNVAKTPPLIRNAQNQLPRAQGAGAWVSRAPWPSICQTQYAKLIVQIQSASFALICCTCILPSFQPLKFNIKRGTGRVAQVQPKLRVRGATIVQCLCRRPSLVGVHGNLRAYRRRRPLRCSSNVEPISTVRWWIRLFWRIILALSSPLARSWAA